MTRFLASEFIRISSMLPVVVLLVAGMFSEFFLPTH